MDVIVNSRVSKLEAVKNKDGPVSGLRVNIDIQDIGGKGEDLAVSYIYSVDYLEGIGKIAVSGELTDRVEKKAAEDVRKAWKEKKENLPQEYKLSLMNSINYVGSIEAVVASKIVRLPPPIAPPRLGPANKQ